MKSYDHRKIEKKWQEDWEKSGVYRTEEDVTKPKAYVLDMFPYPSGEGLHVGHPKGYIATDIYSRHARMNGKSVLHPMGWDAFGLPAENYAIKNKVHPRVAVEKNIARFKEQLKLIGLDYDWGREINTTDPEFYKWTQWIFLKLHEKGLAYESFEPINWCPSCQTGLANEDLEGNACERCGTIVEKRPMRQWILKITDYAERLLSDLELLPEWQSHIKESQRNWIGKSEGAEIEFPLTDTIRRVILLHGKGGTGTGAFKPWLKSRLEKLGYEVHSPDLPNSTEPNDDEQADFLQKNFKLDASTAILGHSFGGIVALRLLERGVNLGRIRLLEKPITPRFKDGMERSSVAEALQKGFDFEKIKANCGGFIALYDTNDNVVALSDGESYARELHCLLLTTKAMRSHFNDEIEPEVLRAVIPSIRVFTTRADTLFGATFLILSPEHPWVQLALRDDHAGVLKNQAEVRAYAISASKKTEIERQENKEKTGVKLEGVEAINPATGEKIPLYVADYVLANYGTGAIMAVPAHDERDYEFAQKFNIHIVPVNNGEAIRVKKPTKEQAAIITLVDEKYKNKISAYSATRHSDTNWTHTFIFKNSVDRADFLSDVKTITEETVAAPYTRTDPDVCTINSGEFNDLSIDEAKEKMIEKFGIAKTTYKLRDWVFSRQRYWGEPIPMVHCEKCGTVPVPYEQLPITLPEVEHYEPTGNGESPLAAISEWVNTTCPKCGGAAKRETNTMPQWAGSSWYYLRYMDPNNDSALVDPAKEKYWAPVDLYVGGAEHATRHLIYARFWHKFLFDIGAVSTQEPFTRLISVGLIQAEDGRKMSKRFGNVINPDDIVETYGADTRRIYDMFMGAFTDAIAWKTASLIGARRFIERVWRLQETLSNEVRPDMERILHQTIKKVSDDIRTFKFNTAISQMMIFVNEAEKGITNAQYTQFITLLAPFAPHIAEDIWHELGNTETIHRTEWPTYDASKVVTESVTIVVQINGKVRAQIEMPTDSSEVSVRPEAEKAAGKWLEGKDIKKAIFVPNRLVNFVLDV